MLCVWDVLDEYMINERLASERLASCSTAFQVRGSHQNNHYLNNCQYITFVFIFWWAKQEGHLVEKTRLSYVPREGAKGSEFSPLVPFQLYSFRPLGSGLPWPLKISTPTISVCYSLYSPKYSIHLFTYLLVVSPRMWAYSYRPTFEQC